MKLSNKSMEFLEREVFPKMNITNITEDNARLIVDYIVDNYEVPLSQIEEPIEIADKQLLETASNVVTEITKNW